MQNNCLLSFLLSHFKTSISNAIYMLYICIPGIDIGKLLKAGKINMNDRFRHLHISLTLLYYHRESISTFKFLREKKSLWQRCTSVRPLLVWAAREKRKAFDRPLPTRQLREKLMAMINDKGPEESRDTDATYIISPHQSEHLPGPSLSLSLARPYLLPIRRSQRPPPPPARKVEKQVTKGW